MQLFPHCFASLGVRNGCVKPVRLLIGFRNLDVVLPQVFYQLTLVAMVSSRTESRSWVAAICFRWSLAASFAMASSRP